MLFSGELYIGIDLTRGEKSICYSALNEDLETITLSQGDYQSLLAYLGGQQNAVLGIYGPARPNLNIMVDAERRSQFLVEMGKGRPGNMRVAEYFLKQHKLPTYQTPNTEQSAPDWMQTSFKLTKHLHKIGYQIYAPGDQADQQFVEVLPEVGFCAWIEGEVLPRKTFHGRMQRQLVLYEFGVRLPDPMGFFEEVTRYKILQGMLPEKLVMSAGILSSLAAAYLAWQARHEPENITLVGLEQEGRIAVPKKAVHDSA